MLTNLKENRPKPSILDLASEMRRSYDLTSGISDSDVSGVVLTIRLLVGASLLTSLPITPTNKTKARIKDTERRDRKIF